MNSSSNMMNTTFDFIVVGAGSAGCVMAARLSKASESVLLLEAGGPADNPDIGIPGRLYHLFGTDIDWSYKSDPQPHLNNRVIDLTRGKVVGGTSALNGMIYIRGHPLDFDRWAELGNEGWAYQDVLPYFKRAERFEEQQSEDTYGTSGPLNISLIPDVLGHTERFLTAGEQIGLPRNANFNGARQDGVGPFHHNTKDGRRQTLADAYLKPALGRSNLHVKTSAHVTRILFRGNRAVGIEYRQGQQLKTATASEIILCGGAINSPQILLHSGIGPAEQLARFDIPVVADLTGVGQNLQDHPLLFLSFQATSSPRVDASKLGQAYAEYSKHRSGPLLSTRTFAGAFWNTKPDLPAPDMQAFFSIGELSDDNDFAVALSLLRPESRGVVRLRSADPFAPPSVNPNYLAADEDLRVYIDSVRIARQLVGAPAFADFLELELAPGGRAESDADIAAWIRRALATTWHYSGTCKMGCDPWAVVDPQLRVRGVEGLRVADASIMPEIVGGNINAATVMIAEKAADLVSS